MRRTHGGFTIIEILVVISIIALLAALLLPALTMLRNKQKAVQTQKLLQNVSFALDMYLPAYALFGTTTATKTLSSGVVVSEDAYRAPLKFLVADPEEPYLELKRVEMATSSFGQVASASEAEVLLDAWFQPITFLVENRGTGNVPGPPFTYTEKIQLISRGASERKADDVTYGMELAEGRWKQEEVIAYDQSDYLQ